MSAVIPARMLNEVVYCPRLYALEHVDGEWADSADTIRGRTVHRRVDQPTAAGLPAPEDGGDPEPRTVRSVTLSDEALGIVAKVDLVEATGDRAVPVDYKKGRRPPVPEGAWEPERVQLCAQGLLLRAHGYRCDEGVLYFHGSRQRVTVPFTDALVARTLRAVEEAREIQARGTLPPPLVDSPKCLGCSLAGICLPDETNLLEGRGVRVRTLAPPRDDGVPLYVEDRGAKLGKSGGEIVVKKDGKVVQRVRMHDTSRVVVTGAVAVSTPLMLELASRDIPMSVHTWSGKLAATLVPSSGHNVLSRIAQHRAASDPQRALAIARAIIQGKIANQRVMLRRNGRDVPQRVLDHMADWMREAEHAGGRDQLLGLEGTAARTYFEHLPNMLRDAELAESFDANGRQRRPPRDPINAMLSFAYALLLSECVTALQAVGLDAWVGVLHQPRPGRPALALDLMEAFRPVLADSAVLHAVNNGVLRMDDFVVHRAGTSLRDAGRRRFIRTFEQRMAHEIRHPAFDTPMSYRRILAVQARLLAKTFRGDLSAYPAFRVR